MTILQVPITHIALTLCLLFSATSASARTIYFVLNPYRSQASLEKDALAILKEVAAAKPEDMLVCFDIYGQDVFQLNVKGSSLSRKRQMDSAVASIRNYCRVAIEKYLRMSESHNIPEILSRISERLKFEATGKNFVVLFDGGIHKSDAFSFNGCWPSDGFITNPASPFFQIGSLPGRWIFVVEPNEFNGLQHQNKLKAFYAKLISRKGGVLVGFSSVRDQIRSILSQDIATSLISNLQIQDEDLTLYTVSEPKEEDSSR